jgi:DNA-binding Lrp family transcriptional regulator
MTRKVQNVKPRDSSQGEEFNHLQKTRVKIDKLDMQIMGFLIAGNDSKYIAERTRTPLSTVQRRIRRLFERDLLSKRVELNYDELGYKRGFLHIYISGGQVDKIGETVVNRPGILSVAVHIGNSDLVALFIYKDSKQLLEITNATKLIDGVERVVWSEEVYFIPSKRDKFNILNT